MSKIDESILDAPNGLPQLDPSGNLVGSIILRQNTWVNLKNIALGASEASYATMQRTERHLDNSAWLLYMAVYNSFIEKKFINRRTS